LKGLYKVQDTCHTATSISNIMMHPTIIALKILQIANITDTCK